MTTQGYRIVPTDRAGQAGLCADAQSRRSRRRLRGAARLPDGPGQRAAPFARLEGHDAALLRDHLRRALHLGRDGWYPAESARTDLHMIRPVFTEIALFVMPFALYVVFLWAIKADVLHPDSWPASRIATLTIVALALMVGELFLFRRIYRRAAGLDLYPGAYRKRQIRAGDDQVTSASATASAGRRGLAERRRAAAAARSARSRRRGSARGRRRGAQCAAQDADP